MSIAEWTALAREVSRPAVQNGTGETLPFREWGQPDCCPDHAETWPRLVDALTGALAEAESLRALLLEVEWASAGSDGSGDQCPSCNEWKERGHASDCRLAAALKGF